MILKRGEYEYSKTKKQIEKIPDDGIDVEVHAWNARDTFPQRLGGGVSMKKLARSHDKFLEAIKDFLKVDGAAQHSGDNPTAWLNTKSRLEQAIAEAEGEANG